MRSGEGFRRAALALLLLWLAALGCALPGRSAPEPAPPPSPLPSRGSSAASWPLAGTPLTTLPAVTPPAFAPLPPAPPPEPQAAARPLPALDEPGNTAALATLSRAEREHLAARGFVAVPGSQATFGELYGDLSADGLPLLFTSDAALYALDVIADVAWQRAETQLAGHLRALSSSLVAASQAQWEAAGDEETAEAAWHNLAFFSVAARLLDPDFAIPGVVADVVAEELTLIEQSGAFISPLRGETVDYGRLQPSGRYAADATLARVFRARQWLGQPFTISADEPEAARRHARQLALMAMAVDASENGPRWQRIADTLAYFENSDSTTSLEAVSAALEALGPGTALEGERIDDLVATLLALPAPAGHTPPSAPAFAFLPPAASPAQMLLPAFVYNQVGLYEGVPPLPVTARETNIGPVRALPRMLDAAAAFGGEAAREWLVAGNDDRYQGYDAQLATVQTALPLIPSARYGPAWLQSMQTLLAPPPSGRDSAFEQVGLNSWLGGWLLLHHDTTLAPRPVDWVSAQEAAGPAFVHAPPQLLGALAALSRQVEQGLRERELLDAEAGQKLLQLERLYLALQQVAEADRAGEPLDADSLLLLRQLAPRLEALLAFAPSAEGVPLADVSLARQVTLYTDPASGTSMTAGLGPAWSLYAIVERDGSFWLAAGGIFATYELRQAPGEAETPDPQAVETAPWLRAILAPPP